MVRGILGRLLGNLLKITLVFRRPVIGKKYSGQTTRVGIRVGSICLFCKKGYNLYMISAKKLAFLKSLQQKKDRQQEGQFIIDNPKVILEQRRHKLFRELYIIEAATEKYKQALRGIKYQIISEAELKKISPSITPQGMLAVFALPPSIEFNYGNEQILLLDGIQDPGNVGTIIRTADWFGIKSIFLNSACADVFSPKTVAASMGSIFQVKLFPDQDLAKLIVGLQKHGFKIVAADSHAQTSVLPSGKLGIVIGSEARGVEKKILDLADIKYKIAGSGQVESLNAAVAAGIILYQLNSPR
ncbi:MAG: RNA methyltransferase [Patescibacteria group bacterium]